jgi:penicillin-binding protein-related factor A (putative recombinase)
MSACSVFREINFSRKIATLIATQGEKLSLECYYTSLSPSPAKTRRKNPLHFPSPSFTFYTAYLSVYGFHTFHFQRKHTQKLFRFTQAELSGSGVRFFRLRHLSAQLCMLFAFLIFPSTKYEKTFRLESNILLHCSL